MSSTLAHTSRDIRVVPVSEIEPQRVEWLVPRRVAYGSLTLLVGQPGVGKSLYSTMLAASLSAGAYGDSRDVLLLTAEDAIAHTVRPRLSAAGADLDRCHVVQAGPEGFDVRLQLPDDIAVLEGVVGMRQPGLVVVDPFVAFLPGKVNVWRDQDVRSALAPLHALAERAEIAVVLIAHLNKSRGVDPISRVGGSVGIPAAARNVLLFARDPADPDGEKGGQRVLAHVKANLGAVQPSVRHDIRTITVQIPGAESLTVPTLHVVGEVGYGASELLERSAGTGSAITQAVEFLECALDTGPRPAREIEEEAADEGISQATLRRAKEQLEVESAKNGFTDGWLWTLPGRSSSATQ